MIYVYKLTEEEQQRMEEKMKAQKTSRGKVEVLLQSILAECRQQGITLTEIEMLISSLQYRLDCAKEAVANTTVITTSFPRNH